MQTTIPGKFENLLLALPLASSFWGKEKSVTVICIKCNNSIVKMLESMYHNNHTGFPAWFLEEEKI